MIAVNIQNHPSIRQRLTAGQIARELDVDRTAVVMAIRALGIVPIATHALEYDGDDIGRVEAWLTQQAKGEADER